MGSGGSTEKSLFPLPPTPQGLCCHVGGSTEHPERKPAGGPPPDCLLRDVISRVLFVPVGAFCPHN